MKIRRLLLLFPVALALLLLVLYLGLDFWLESAGGKRALEKNLEGRVGMTVRIEGDLKIRMLPRPGVSATQLSVADPVTGDDIAVGKAIKADLALMPLFREELDVQQLTIEGLRLNLPGGNGLFFPEIRLEGFGFDKPTGFFIDWSWMGKIEGQFTWYPAQFSIDLDASWYDSEWHDIVYRGNIVYGADSIRFSPSRVTIGSQTVTGEGCLLLAGSPALHLDMEADRLDVGALTADLPGGQGEASELPVLLNLRLRARELVRGELRAHDAVIELGEPPFCP